MHGFRKCMKMLNNDFSYEIRWARPEDWKKAMDMVWDTFIKFEGEDYSSEGIRNFYDFIYDDGLYRSFINGDYLAMVALDGEKIVGFASVRDGNLLSLLFVEESYHREGIGKALVDRFCTYLKREMGQTYMKVKASPYGLGFYERIGFVAIMPEQRYAGIRVTPMERYL